MKTLIAVFTVVAISSAVAQERKPDARAEEKISERKPITIYFEQAQQRANYAHEQLMTAQRKLKQAVRAERAATEELAMAQRKCDDAKQRADVATQASQAAQSDEAAAQERWSKEAASLEEAHREMENGHAVK